LRISRSFSFSRSRPLKRISPLTIFPAGFAIRPMIDSEVIDFPHPDSPTIPSVFFW
jgi:hypothetical protein